MNYASRIGVLSAFAFCSLGGPSAWSQEETGNQPSVQEIREILDSMDPYLPQAEVRGEIDVFGSTSMDSMAHGWAIMFKKFHPQCQIVISAEGSETVLERMTKNPSSVGMVSRPVTAEELEALKQKGLKQPLAVTVAREALGVFVHEDNPLESITYGQLLSLFCGDADSKPITWATLEVKGPLADQPVQIFSRGPKSGTQQFVERYVFRARQPLPAKTTLPSNTKLVKAVQDNPAGVAICGLKCGGHGARALHLRDNQNVIPDDDHAVLIGRYPLTRPMTLVLDAGRTDAQAAASREFVRFALSRGGQMQAILAGFFPFDPPALRAELRKLDGEEQQPAVANGGNSPALGR